jgi:hypothetical protein
MYEYGKTGPEQLLPLLQAERRNSSTLGVGHRSFAHACVQANLNPPCACASLVQLCLRSFATRVSRRRRPDEQDLSSSGCTLSGASQAYMTVYSLQVVNQASQNSRRIRELCALMGGQKMQRLQASSQRTTGTGPDSLIVIHVFTCPDDSLWHVCNWKCSSVRGCFQPEGCASLQTCLDSLPQGLCRIAFLSADWLPGIWTTLYAEDTSRQGASHCWLVHCSSLYSTVVAAGRPCSLPCYRIASSLRTVLHTGTAAGDESAWWQERANA